VCLPASCAAAAFDDLLGPEQPLSELADHVFTVLMAPTMSLILTQRVITLAAVQLHCALSTGSGCRVLMSRVSPPASPLIFIVKSLCPSCYGPSLPRSLTAAAAGSSLTAHHQRLLVQSELTQTLTALLLPQQMPSHPNVSAKRLEVNLIASRCNLTRCMCCVFPELSRSTPTSALPTICFARSFLTPEEFACTAPRSPRRSRQQPKYFPNYWLRTEARRLNRKSSGA
jgi:hypothetical protein